MNETAPFLTLHPPLQSFRKGPQKPKQLRKGIWFNSNFDFDLGIPDRGLGCPRQLAEFWPPLTDDLQGQTGITENFEDEQLYLDIWGQTEIMNILKVKQNIWTFWVLTGICKHFKVKQRYLNILKVKQGYMDLLTSNRDM